MFSIGGCVHLLMDEVLNKLWRDDIGQTERALLHL